MGHLVARQENSLPKVYLFSVATRKRIEATDGWYGSNNPVFSDDGKYLVLASARDFNPTFGQEEFSEIYRNMERVYLIPWRRRPPPRSPPRAMKSARRTRRKKPDDERSPDDDKKPTSRRSQCPSRWTRTA